MKVKKTRLILGCDERTGLLYKFLTQGLGAVAEYKFHPTRKWRFDFAFVEQKVAVEQEGAIWTYGRHNRPIGMIKDMEKYNAAAELGWRVLRYQPRKFDLEQIKKVVGKWR